MTKGEAIQVLKEYRTIVMNCLEAETPAFDMAIEALSANAVPTVIRAKTFMRKEDFDKWAEDIKKQNKSIVCIPCDAEVVSANAVQGEWHKTENEEMEITGYYCSVCDMPTDEPTNYCGNCGAAMRETK